MTLSAVSTESGAATEKETPTITWITWPLPPYCSIAPGDETSGPEACLVYFRDGRKVYGTLKEFSPNESSLLIRENGAEASQTVAFDQIKSLRLVGSVELEREAASLEQRAEEIFSPSEKQTFKVEYADGEVLTGDTVGTSVTDYGLFLFLPTEDERIVRCFIPGQAMRRYQIGAPIGEILIEEQLANKQEITEALERQRHAQYQRIGEFLTESQILTRESLKTALKHQEHKPILKLGEALLQLGLVTEKQLNAALEKQKSNRDRPLGQILIEMGAEEETDAAPGKQKASSKPPLGKILMEMGVVDERTLNGVMAKKLGVPYVSLARFNVDPNAVKMVGAAFARAHVLMPLYIESGSLVVALENSLNAKAIDELRFLTQMRIVPVMASRQDILNTIAEYYSDQGGTRRATAAQDARANKNEIDSRRAASGDMKIDELAMKLAKEDATIEFAADEAVAESDSTLVQLVNKMILDAYHGRASDIHIETYPGRQNTRIRFRVDGTLTDYTEIPSNFRNALVSRIKIMSQLDISERRKPQDGKIDFQQFGPAKLKLRVATMPTASGLEDVVMRLLDSATPIPMEQLELEPGALSALKKAVDRPYGLILVCGPTGSGKTTTLHSLLAHINTPARKIWTAEDPIEITQQGLRQVQVHPKIGWTFAAAMRGFLRVDPDVIMVGEMRDRETAQTCIEASLTGHLVMSTLHTNSAPESIVRLLDLGMDPFNFTDALLAVLAQRLVKTLCPACKHAYHPAKSELEELAAEYCQGFALEPAKFHKQWMKHASGGELKLYRAKGCEKCNHTGYRGRMGLHELLTGSPAMRKLIQAGAPVDEIFPAAVAAGMRTLKQDGISKVILGKTDMSQVRTVCS